MLNLISSLDLWLSWKTLVSAVFVFLLGAARPKESQDFQAAAAAAAAASHPKSCESDHNDGGVGGIPLWNVCLSWDSQHSGTSTDTYGVTQWSPVRNTWH